MPDSIGDKASHKDYNSNDGKQETKNFLNNEIFNRNKSTVRDRNAIEGGPGVDYEGGQLLEFYTSYLIAFAEVFSDVDFRDGDGFLDTTQLLVNGDIDDHLFVRLYRSGFYPWPGFPELPDSIGEGINAFFGGQ